MRRAATIARKGTWPDHQALGAVMLDYDMRQRRRVRLDCEAIGPVLLDIERPVGLREGDGLGLDDGGWVAVRAAPEDLLRIEAADRLHLLRIVWHLGNRHCPAEIDDDCVHVRADHVIAEMAHGLGATVTPITRPFDPEGGAYHAGGHHHG